MTSATRHDIGELTGFAMDVIHQVGEKALAFYGKGEPQIKFDEELVTEAELRLSDFFLSQLQGRFPDHHLFKDNFENTDYTDYGTQDSWLNIQKDPEYQKLKIFAGPRPRGNMLPGSTPN